MGDDLPGLLAVNLRTAKPPSGICMLSFLIGFFNFLLILPASS